MAVDEPAPPAGAQHPSGGGADRCALRLFRICPRLGLDSCRRPRATRIRAPNPSRISPPLVARHPRALEGRRPAVPTRRLREARHRRRSRRPRSSPLLVLTHDRVVARASRLTTARPPPPSPSRQPLVAKYRGELDDKLSRLAELQARYETDGEVALRTRAHARRAASAAFRRRRRLRRAPRAPPANRGRNTNANACAARCCSSAWVAGTRSEPRFALLRSRSATSRIASSRRGISSARWRIDARAARRVTSPRASRSRPRWNTTPTRSSVRGRICRGTRRSGRVVFGSSTDVSRRRTMRRRAQDEALATFATMPDPKLPPWWNPDCDLFLLCGAREHGFGKYDETLATQRARRDSNARRGLRARSRAALLASERASRVRRRRRRRRGG